MTLIAAFRCDKGAVICADSQESVGDYIVTVKKLKPRDNTGYYELIVGGSSNVGALVDGLCNTIERNVRDWPADLDEEGARSFIEDILASYHEKQVVLYPVIEVKGEGSKKRIWLVICIKKKNSSDIYLWKTDGPVIERIDDYELVGFEEYMYHNEVQWLHNPNLWANAVVILGIRLFLMAKETSQFIGGDTQVVTVTEDGVKIYGSDDVKVIEGRVIEWNKRLAELVLLGIDLSQNEYSILEFFRRFEEDTFALRAWFTGRTSIIDDIRMWDAIQSKQDATLPTEPEEASDSQEPENQE